MLGPVAGLCCEVIWLRYMGFFSNVPYVFTYILGMYLIGMGAGSLVYRFLLARHGRPLSVLAWVLFILGWSVPSFFAAGTLILSLGEPGTTSRMLLMVVILVVPSVLMGMTFPLVCSAFAGSLAGVGRSVGIVYAVNTMGSIIGSLIPIFVLIPVLGMQQSILLMGLGYAGMGLVLLAATSRRRRGLKLTWSGVCGALMVIVFTAIVPGDLCKRSFLAGSDRLGRHNDILFYQEGRTGTAIVVRDKVSGFKSIYINGIEEAPTTYADMVCFKLLGGLGPLLHPNPDKVAMICFGGGIAAGSAVQHPDVKLLEVVDLESSVVDAAGLLTKENNDLLRNSKLRVAIDDGRNYILVSRKTWPVIVSDSTHPKSSDSWVLYTREFYELISAHLSTDGVFVQWLPMHDLSVAEYKIILRTFQSVFPHASLWISHGISEMGGYNTYTLLVSTPRRLAIDVEILQRKLSAPAVVADLRPWGLGDPVGVLENFVCGEESLRRWTGQGVINTDDLPYTQYKTRYSGDSGKLENALAGLIESVWSYLENTGSESESGALKQALALHRKANRLMFLGKYEEAFSLLPADGRVRRWRENQKRSVEHVSRVASFYRDCPRILARLGSQLFHMGETQGAIDQIERAIAIKGDDAEAHFNLALAQARQGKADQAVANFERAITIKSDYAAAHFNLGAVRAQQGRLDEAIGHFKRAIVIDPDDSEAHFNLGKARTQQGGLDEAIGHFERAVAANPDYAEAHSHLGAVRELQGKLKEAVDHYKRAIAVNGDYAEAHFSLAAAQARRGRLGEAIDHYKRAIAVKGDYVEAYANLGALLVRQGWLNEAAAHFKRAIALKGDYAEAHNNLGAVRAQQGSLDQAVACYERAIAIKSDYAEAHTNLGVSRAQQGRLEEAIAHYRKAISVAPRHFRARCLLGQLLAGQGKLDEAIAQFSEVLRMDPKHPNARSGLRMAKQLKVRRNRQ